MATNSRLHEEIEGHRTAQRNGEKVPVEVKFDLIFRGLVEILDKVDSMRDTACSKQEMSALCQRVDHMQDPVIRRIIDRLEVVESSERERIIRDEERRKADERASAVELARIEREERAMERRDANVKWYVGGAVSVLLFILGVLVAFFNAYGTPNSPKAANTQTQTQAKP